MLRVLFGLIVRSVRSRPELLLENLALRQQLAARAGDVRSHDTAPEKLLGVLLRKFRQGWRGCLPLVQPENVIADVQEPLVRLRIRIASDDVLCITGAAGQVTRALKCVADAIARKGGLSVDWLEIEVDTQADGSKDNLSSSESLSISL